MATATAAPDGTAGPGARFHIVEALGANLAYLVDSVADVLKADDTGRTLSVRTFAMEVIRIEHTFPPVPEGTLFPSRTRVHERSSRGDGPGLAQAQCRGGRQPRMLFAGAVCLAGAFQGAARGLRAKIRRTSRRSTSMTALRGMWSFPPALLLNRVPIGGCGGQCPPYRSSVRQCRFQLTTFASLTLESKRVTTTPSDSRFLGPAMSGIRP